MTLMFHDFMIVLLYLWVIAPLGSLMCVYTNVNCIHVHGLLSLFMKTINKSSFVKFF